MAWYIGLMSGTSLDGVDGVLAEIPEAAGDVGLRSHDFVHLPIPPSLRCELLALNTPGDNEIHRAALAANALMALYAQAVDRLLNDSGFSARAIAAIGAHGQTVRHRPGEFDGTGYTTQLVNGALLAERCGIDVVCDFRSRDVAAGGQGAPLVPAFHAACFAREGIDVAVLNLGGIANLSLLPARGDVLGFDCGPGNVLLDLWCQRHRGQAFDADGAWAAAGCVRREWLHRWLAEPYFDRAPPKSTGRDLFNAEWLDARIDHGTDPRDAMATLAELTSESVALALARHAPATRQLLVCGGGAHNGDLLARLASRLAPGITVATTLDAGIPPDQVEALAFAWLAGRFRAAQAGNLPAVTGARGSRVLGALYPAG